MPASVPSFAVISGAAVARALAGHHHQIVHLIRDAYHAHGQGHTVNPPSYFLRFPDRPTSRIIALPASLNAHTRVDGLKWISSFPDNITTGLPRASAVLILNDPTTGYPLACLESSIISATRTAASATLAADLLTTPHTRPTRLGIIGTGLIARYIRDYLTATGWTFDHIGVHDLIPDYATTFATTTHHTTGQPVRVHDHVEDLIRDSDLIVFATTATQPHITTPTWFDHHPLVLHVSLRDLSPDVVLACTNIVDDVDHCLQANTSVHLTEQHLGHRDFITATLPQIITAGISVPHDRPVLFSPFGLGILDLAIGKHVYDTLHTTGQLTLIDDFFHDMSRYGTAS